MSTPRATPAAAARWRPQATRAQLALRAQMLAQIRAHFARAGVLEVETPVLAASGSTDPRLASFTTLLHRDGNAGTSVAGTPLYLHTSPEFAMKRLLAAGSGSIYQICKVFRNGESGRVHNPEFTLLEWYRVDWSYRDLMDEVAALIGAVLAPTRALAQPEHLSYAQAFADYCGIDPWDASVDRFAAVAREHGIVVANNPDLDRDAYCDLLLTHIIEPRLGRDRVTLLYDYPPSQAALARIRNDARPVAERFEAYLFGMELANGFQELRDETEQRDRFRADNARRIAAGLPAIPLDENLLAALAHGLPACAGVALGVDRLLMAASGASALGEVLAFPLTP